MANGSCLWRIHRYVGEVDRDLEIAKRHSRRALRPRLLRCPGTADSAEPGLCARFRYAFALPSRTALRSGGNWGNGLGQDRVVFLGDTVNTAARLQEFCRQAGDRVLASAALLNFWSCPLASPSARSATCTFAVRKVMLCFTRWRKSAPITQRLPRGTVVPMQSSPDSGQMLSQCGVLHSCTLEATCTSIRLC